MNHEGTATELQLPKSGTNKQVRRVIQLNDLDLNMYTNEHRVSGNRECFLKRISSESLLANELRLHTPSSGAPTPVRELITPTTAP